MSTSIIGFENFISCSNHNPCRWRVSSLRNSSDLKFRLSGGRSGCYAGLIVRAQHDGKRRNTRRKRKWWKWIFSNEEDGWFGLNSDDFFVDEAVETSDGEELSDKDKFEAWKRRAEAIVELREAQQDMLNEESKRWEDWIVDGDLNVSKLPHDSWLDSDGPSGNGYERVGEDVVSEPIDLVPRKGIVDTVRRFIAGNEEDDMLYEDRVFQFASVSAAKFFSILVLIPWVLDFAVHDYVLMPFLDRYVKTVPLAAEMLDARRSQKLKIVKELNFEKERILFEVEIGKAPPLSDEELWWELRNKALELREDQRLENRIAFANIWSDTVFGISLFILLYLNPSKVALLKFTGYKIINNISDVGKAFIIILVSDIFLGYHSESGWETLLEVIIEHYGFEYDEVAVTIFISVVPVAIDTCVKLWFFKFLPRLSPRVANILREMKRH